jgi:hypothetical protein
MCTTHQAIHRLLFYIIQSVPLATEPDISLNNCNTNEDIATKCEQEYVLFFHISYTMRYVRFKFRCNILISGKIIKEMSGSVASGTPCTLV